MKLCDIIVPVWNQPDPTKRTVDSIIKNTGYPFRLIIIDNGSDKPTEEYLKSLHGKTGLNVIIIRNEKNLGFVKAVNQGIERSDAPYICIANNDIIVTVGWLDEMIRIMEANPDIGIINPSSNTSGENPARGESIEEYALRLAAFKGKTQELYTCRGFCMLLRKTVLSAIGPLDEIYHVGYFDDTDYCKRAQEKGFKTVRAKGSYIYHEGNVSFKVLNNNRDLFKKNEKIFYERWGRQVRVGYFIDRIRSAGRIDDIAQSVVRIGHQISIYMKSGAEWPVTIDHYDIRRIDLNPVFFRLLSVYKIFKRKKKKRIDVVVTDDLILGRALKACGFAHGSEVLVNATTDALLNIVKEKSKVF